MSKKWIDSFDLLCYTIARLEKKMTCVKCDKEAWLLSPMPGYYRYKCTCGWDSGFVHLDQRTTRDHEYYAMKMYKYTEREKEYEKSTECV